MTKAEFVTELHSHLKRTTTRKEKLMAYSAFRLLGLEDVKDIPQSWYVK